MTDKTKKAADAEAAVLAKIAEWREPYRAMGERIHRIILETVPELRPRLWYGMPGYAKGGPVLLFFRVDDLMSFGLTEKAHLSVDEGAPDQLIESAWFLSDLDKPTEERIAAIVRKAAG
ncbi:MAG: DUF1801 domain-containing protein [Acidimicrobiia bacterium]|nr:DUF1801 domain-containing protein [Acidimicrobiia bacterium]